MDHFSGRGGNRWSAALLWSPFVILEVEVILGPAIFFTGEEILDLCCCSEVLANKFSQIELSCCFMDSVRNVLLVILSLN